MGETGKTRNTGCCGAKPAAKPVKETKATPKKK